MNNRPDSDSSSSTSSQDSRPGEAQIRRQARRRVELKLGWLTHATVFVLVNLGLYLLSSLGQGGSGARWHSFPLWGWGLGLAIHGVVTLLALGGGDLRERMMNSELERLRGRG